jgi:hypothetical protein
MFGEDKYEEMMKEIVRVGAVDGYTGKEGTSVDGISYEKNLLIFNKLKELSERENMEAIHSSLIII